MLKLKKASTSHRLPFLFFISIHAGVAQMGKSGGV